MEPGGSKQDGGVVNMTRAMAALSPWLNHPRRTIIQVEALVVAAAVLLLLQLILGSCMRRWHKSIFNYAVQASKLMNPLIIYTLGTMQSSPIKNSSYPVWAAFLIMASVGTTAVQQYDFCDSFYSKYMQVMGDYFRDFFYIFMTILLLSPNPYTFKAAFNLNRRLKNARTSSRCVICLLIIVFYTKFIGCMILAILGYNWKGYFFFKNKMKLDLQVAETRTEETANDRVSDSGPQSMKGYKYAVCSLPSQLITIEQIWDCCGNSAYGKALKDLCLSCALFRRLVGQRYFGVVYRDTNRLKDHNFVFKKLLPSEVDFKRAFRIIEVELGFCYDFFFTKYYCTFTLMNLFAVPFIQPLTLVKIILILIIGVFAIGNSLVLETPSPIIEVPISEDGYIITLVVLSIALIVEIVQAAIYLASNWAQVSLACIYVKKYWWQPNAVVIEKVNGFFRKFMISGVLRNEIDQDSIFRRKQPQPVEVSDAVKRAIARSLISIYGNNLTTHGETSLWQNPMFEDYSWALEGLSQVEVMLIWHIATEYCDISSPTSNRTTRCRCNKHRGFATNLSRYCADLFGYVLQLLPNHRRNRIVRDSHQGVAVHLSRYCAYLIQSVPKLLPYHEADIAELVEKVMEERNKLFGSDYFRPSKIYNKMKNLQGDDNETMFQKGVKLGNQLERLPDGDHRWEVLKDFWAETIIHAAASHYTTMQHMQHLENGGEFLTHIWALLSHAGILTGTRIRRG
ncbi:unnamed protein product [Miscanthus lutarioriparius]|uniref:DUF4220 domain-containing protein n=1 Tax=Miscanthus lutarioriparius TaxID=422564 RepID=A0A811N5V7_9POAL|nr:unnamed protein product [Miscanthus lutarioriparius]